LTVTVTRGAYVLLWENTSSSEKARLVSEAVVKAARSHEQLNVVFVDETCTDRDCLKNIAEANQSTQAAAAQVTENLGHYTVRLVFLDKTVEDEHTGSFAEVVDKVVDMTQKALFLKTLDNEEPASAAASLEVSKAAATTSLLAPAPPPAKTDMKNKPFKKALFFTTLGLTVSTAVAFGIVEGLAQHSWNKLESDRWTSLDAWTDERDRHRHLQISSRCLLGMGGGLFIFTLTAYFFTDFGKSPNAILAISPDGLISITGSF
jgi:hypothetical protein